MGKSVEDHLRRVMDGYVSYTRVHVTLTIELMYFTMLCGEVILFVGGEKKQSYPISASISILHWTLEFNPIHRSLFCPLGFLKSHRGDQGLTSTTLKPAQLANDIKAVLGSCPRNKYGSLLKLLQTSIAFKIPVLILQKAGYPCRHTLATSQWNTFRTMFFSDTHAVTHHHEYCGT